MNLLQNLWGGSKSERDARRLRKCESSLNKTIRELRREEANFAQREKQLTVEIKKTAKEGHMNAAKIQAKDLVRTRKNMDKFTETRIQFVALQIRLKATRGTITIEEAMKSAGEVVKNMNRNSNLPNLQRIAMEFERESTLMEQRQEIMDDAMDEATGVDEDVDEDEILDKVLASIGVDLKYSMGETPQGIQGTAVAAEGKVAQAIGGGDPGDDELQARLNGLRR